MFKKSGVVLNPLKQKRGLTLIVLAALLLELISGIQYYYMHGILSRELEKHAEIEITMKAVVTNSALNLAVNSLEGHIWDIMLNLDHPDSMYSVSERVLRSHPNLLGCGMAFVPDYYPHQGRLFEPYAYWEDGKVKLKQVAVEQHDYTKSPSFMQACYSEKPSWTDAYEDVVTGKRMVTYGRPIRDKRGVLAGVFGLDLSLEWMSDTLNYRHIYPSSFNVLLSENGMLIAGPKKDSDKWPDVEKVISIINNDSTTKSWSRSQKTRTFSFKSFSGDEAYVFFHHFKGNPKWQIAVVCYEDEIYGPLRQMRYRILLLMVIAFSALGYIIYRYFKNVKSLQETELKEARISSELQIAHRIQSKMLPTVYPPFPDRRDVDVYGSLVPAREVGGDMFDFFMRDEKLYFCIGDVSGKGVPAAMVMSVVYALFRSNSAHESNPSRIMRYINEMLCQGNDSNMFVTMFIGVLNMPTGRLCYCNAGHDKPIIINQQVTTLEAKANLPLGVFDDVKYVTEEFFLPDKSMLFLYTDGLTEAMNMNRKLFGLNRVMQHLSADDLSLTPTQLLKRMDEAVRQFCGSAEQSDDLTMMAISYTPRREEFTFEEELVLSNDIKEVTKLNEFVKSVTEQLNIDKELSKKLRLAVEEAMVNVMNYAYPENVKGEILLRAASNGHQVCFIIFDQGQPFDPTEIARADTNLSADDRPIGGLGILLVRELMDSINYEYSDGKNIFTMRKILN